MAVYSIRKNPYGAIWFAIPIAVALIGGGGAIAVSSTARRENKKDRNVEGVEAGLHQDLDVLMQGNAVSSNRPTTLILPPSSEKVALLQEAVAYRDAASIVINEGGNPDQLIEWFKEALTEARSLYDDTTISSDDPKLIAPLNRASERLAPYGSSMTSLIAKSLGNQDVKLIGEVQEDIARRQPSKRVGEAMEKTVDEVALPFEIAAGLFTGKRPLGLSQLQWNLIRYSIYGGITLGVVGYASSKIAAVGELVKGDD